jgi:hypothetical protein
VRPSIRRLGPPRALGPPDLHLPDLQHELREVGQALGVLVDLIARQEFRVQRRVGELSCRGLPRREVLFELVECLLALFVHADDRGDLVHRTVQRPRLVGAGLQRPLDQLAHLLHGFVGEDAHEDTLPSGAMPQVKPPTTNVTSM